MAPSPETLWDPGFSCHHRNLHRGLQPKGVAKMHYLERPWGVPHGPPSSGMVQPLPCLVPATSSIPCLGEDLPLLINIWELLLLYGARYIKGEKSQFYSLLLLFSIRPRAICLEILTGLLITLMFRVWFCCSFPGLAMASHRFLPCSPRLLHPIQVSLLQSSPLHLLASQFKLILNQNLCLPCVVCFFFFLGTPSV